MKSLIETQEHTFIEELTDDIIGNDHILTSLETPLRSDAFKLSDFEKKQQICILVC